MTSRKSSVSRILSASAASWVRIGVTVIAQVALVPLYLASWSAEVFGAWLLLQAVWAVVKVIDLSHHDYVGYECLRIGDTKRLEITHIIFSAVPFAFLIALCDVLVVWWLSNAEFVARWVGSDQHLFDQWRAALLLQAVTWLFTGCQGGLLVRWLTPFGYNPQFAWWGVFNAVVTAAVPAVAVVCGADLWEAALALCLTNLIYDVIFFTVMARILRSQHLTPTKPNLAEGAVRGLRSLWLTAKYLAEMARQQGSRILLAPLAGAAEMAAFSTMRTGANFALQGLNTVASPVMPELMRFLTMRDQQRMESAFAVVWLVLCAGLAPAVLVVQYLAPGLFPIWTRNKIAFDPWLFSTLSLSVLVLALAQPAAAILQGNNILKTQLAISILAALVAVGGMVLGVPTFGVRGAAFALLVAELVSLSANIWRASQALNESGLRWPWRPFRAVAASVLAAAAGLAALVYFPPANSLVILVLALALQALIVLIYWRRLPPMARIRAAGMVTRFVPLALRPAVTPDQRN